MARRETQAELSEDEVVQGEKLQALASISIVTPSKLDYMRRYKDGARIRQLILPGNHFNFAEITDADVAVLASEEVSSIYVFGALLRSFVRVVAPRLTRPYVLITHNGDECVDASFRAFLDDDRLVRWFAQNPTIAHPKLVPLPIGVANAQWPHGDARVIAAAHSLCRSRLAMGRVVKDRDCYVYFDTSSNEAKRKAAWVAARHFGRAPFLLHPDYVVELARHRFCVCPEGNGPDTHRLWEALYVGTIPIVLRDSGVAHWERAGVPLVVVDSWDQVTPELLAAQDHAALMARAFDLPLLRMSYWRDRIGATPSAAKALRGTPSEAKGSAEV